jgi:hypothetical protein
LPREHRLSTKTPIIGAVSRKGNVVARVLEHVTKEAAEAFVRAGSGNLHRTISGISA